MTTSVITQVREIHPEHWETLRAITLEALKNDQDAFATNLDTALTWTEQDWRSLFTGSTWVAAVCLDRVVGVARSLKAPGRPASERHLESVWVDPSFRRQGVLKAMLGRLPQPDAWMLWVLNGNATARVAWERLGFRWTGECQPLPDGRLESRYRLVVKS